MGLWLILLKKGGQDVFMQVFIIKTNKIELFNYSTRSYIHKRISINLCIGYFFFKLFKRFIIL